MVVKVILKAPSQNKFFGFSFLSSGELEPLFLFRLTYYSSNFDLWKLLSLVTILRVSCYMSGFSSKAQTTKLIRMLDMWDKLTDILKLYCLWWGTRSNKGENSSESIGMPRNVVLALSLLPLSSSFGWNNSSSSGRSFISSCDKQIGATKMTFFSIFLRSSSY